MTAEDAARAFTDLRVISALLCRSWPLSQDLMDSRLAAAVSEHVRRLGAGYHQSPDRQPHGILATAGLLTAAAAVRASADPEGTLARHAQPGRWHNPSQTWARILGRHQSTCSPALREAALPLVTSGSTASRRKRRRTSIAVRDHGGN